MKRAATHAVDAIAGEMERRIGAARTRWTRPALFAAVDRACKRAGAQSADTLLLRLLAGNAQAIDALTAELTVPETYFHRDRLDVVVELVVQTMSRRTGEPTRIWCAGCASGEEPYSLAMRLIERGHAGNVEILATDVSASAIAAASAGVYSDWSFRGVTASERAKWFETRGTSSVLRDRPRQLVRFAKHNLLADPPPELVDVLVCRNVLIYFTPPHVEQAFARFSQALRPNGLLVLGPSDPRPDARSFSPSGVAPTIYVAASTVAPPADHPRTSAVRARVTRRAPVTTPMPVAPAPVVASTPASRAPVSATLEHVRTLADRGSHVEALAVLDEHLRESPSIEAQLLRATVRSADGNHRGALADARHALFRDRSLAYAHVLAATSQAAIGDRPSARRAARNATKRLASYGTGDAVAHAGGATAGQLLGVTKQLFRGGARR